MEKKTAFSIMLILSMVYGVAWAAVGMTGAEGWTTVLVVAGMIVGIGWAAAALFTKGSETSVVDD